MEFRQFPGRPIVASAGYTGCWTIRYLFSNDLTVGGVQVGKAVAVECANPLVAISTAMQLPSGMVFCFEHNRHDGSTYLGAFHGDMHATYARLASGPANGIALLAAIVQLVPDALSPDVCALLGDGDLARLAHLRHSGIIKM